MKTVYPPPQTQFAGGIMRLFTIELQENKDLGAKTWPCYNEILVVVREVIMRLNCMFILPIRFPKFAHKKML